MGDFAEGGDFSEFCELDEVFVVLGCVVCSDSGGCGVVAFVDGELFLLFVLSQGLVLRMFCMAVCVMAGCVFWVLLWSVL